MVTLGLLSLLSGATLSYQSFVAAPYLIIERGVHEALGIDKGVVASVAVRQLAMTERRGDMDDGVLR